MQHNNNYLRYILWIVIILIIQVVSYTSTAAAKSFVALSAKATPTPTPTLTPTPIALNGGIVNAPWRSKHAQRLPGNLAATASMSMGGGSLYGACFGYTPTTETNKATWIASDTSLYPIYHNGVTPLAIIDRNETDGFSNLVNNDYYYLTFTGQYWDNSFKALLIGPDGSSRNMNADPDCFQFSYFFTSQDPDGVYRVEISTPQGSVRDSVTLNKLEYFDDYYQGPRFSVFDAASKRETTKFSLGDKVLIKYRRFEPNEQVTAGLYQLYNKIPVLLNSWVVKVNQRGELDQQLEIPFNAVPGDYIIYAGNDEDSELSVFAAIMNLLPEDAIQAVRFTLSRSGMSKQPVEDIIVAFFKGLNANRTHGWGQFDATYASIGKELQSSLSVQELYTNLLVVDGIGLEGLEIVTSGTSLVVETDLMMHLSSILSSSQRYGHVTWGLERTGNDWKIKSINASYDKPLTPLETTVAFYRALDWGVDTRNFTTAYSLLSQARKKVRSYDALKEIYADTTSVDLESIELVKETATAATVHVIVSTYDDIAGESTLTRYDVEYLLVKENGSWRLDEPKIKELSSD